MASTSVSSTQKRFKYDVFLSFRGEDTRKTFVDHLYHALQQKCIETYKDDEKIQKGKRISDDLINSIQDSKFYIIVFSKNYASSAWCLEELVKIMECQQMTGHTAYPVFYDVEPTEVRKQSGAVGEAFAKHANEGAAGKWRDVLKEASELAGWELKNTFDGHEAKFIQKIVEEISLKLRFIKSDVDGKLIGMETRVKDVVSSLETGVDDVRMIGIKGMGGIGKTTLARAVFDHISIQFEGQSFVENVSKTPLSGLKELQKQVLSDVLNANNITVRSVSDGKNMMKRFLRTRTVLIVLDDVDKVEQLEALANECNWFKPGSIIIITTRDEHVLVAHKVNVIHDINLLTHEEAICLFSRYAFGKEIPIQGYTEFSGQVVCYAAGLPLTIRVLGSFLCGKDKYEWKDVLERLRTIPLKETLEKLELSYVGLEEEYKEIFLDIACILKGMDREYAIRVLECCGFHARNGLKVLEQRSLITISKYGELGVHDHLEEMGKNIVRRSNPDDPSKHSRLWIDEETADILANDMGTETTRCLKLKMLRGNYRILMEGLGKMKKLRYLEVFFEGCFNPRMDEGAQCFPNSLKYLQCSNYTFMYLPKTFQANNLVGLYMNCTKLRQLWEGGEKKVLRKLKFLSLSFSYLTTYDFEITPNLERLSLEYSAKLVELCMPASCEKLNYLYISSSKLRTFDLGLTPNLETLFLTESTNLVELCMPVSCLKLKHLAISESKLRIFDIGLTPNLETLSLEESTNLVLLRMPVSCQKLKHLAITNSKIRNFDLGLTPNLEMLSLEANNNLVELFMHVCCQKLKHLNLSGSKLRTFDPRLTPNLKKLLLDGCADFVETNLLDNICMLESLKWLEFSAARTKHLPDSICMLKHLKCLHLDLCALLEKLPEDLGLLEFLEKLHVSSKKIEYLPDSICMLKRLKSLDVTYCCRLGKLPEDIGQLESLETLTLSGTKIKYLPDSICMLKHLNWFDLDDSAPIEKLPEDLGKLECLTMLHVTSKKIEFLPDSICLLKSLKYLILDGCALLEKLPEDLGRLECLEHLDITDTGISHLPESLFGLKGGLTGLLIAAPPELLQLYDFPSEIKTTTSHVW